MNSEWGAIKVTHRRRLQQVAPEQGTENLGSWQRTQLRKKMNPSGCLSIALGLWRLILMTQTLTHWAYVPDPPIVRPTTWEGVEVLIHVNRSAYSTALDPFIQHTKMGDTSASDIGTPFYFTTSSKGSIPGCIIMLSMTHKIWIPDKNQMYNIQMTSLPTGYPVHANFTPSYMIPRCINSSQIVVSTGKPHPIRYRHVKPFVTNISGTKFQLMDWFGANLTNKYNFGLWWMNGHPQHHVWMLVAALNNITWPNSSLSKNIMSCVSPPHVIMYRPFNISIGANYFNVTCSNCSFTNCLYSGITESILIVRQPSVVMLPVNISKTWYKDSGIQVGELDTPALCTPDPVFSKAPQVFHQDMEQLAPEVLRHVRGSDFCLQLV
ncbi:endogenous retrovirus group K member 21 Env polyprotein-like [Dipodomys merriami]|uniref:endogenous retrovirus group K member 21 Env polyprotein-like n=1 Tax=Dipodomys merriami TaxID=94247 RepID=UPI0038558BF3